MNTTRKFGLTMLLFLPFAFGSKAQTSPDAVISGPVPSNKEWRISIGVETGIPTGAYANTYGSFFGASVQVDAPLCYGLYATVTGGYNNVLAKDNKPSINTQLIPVKAGLRYFFWGDLIYFQAQAGVTFLANRSDLNADNSAAFTYTPGVGALLKLPSKNYLDLGVRWEETASFSNRSDGNRYGLVALRVAYSFGL